MISFLTLVLFHVKKNQLILIFIKVLYLLKLCKYRFIVIIWNLITLLRSKITQIYVN